MRLNLSDWQLIGKGLGVWVLVICLVSQKEEWEHQSVRKSHTLKSNCSCSAAIDHPSISCWGVLCLQQVSLKAWCLPAETSQRGWLKNLRSLVQFWHRQNFGTEVTLEQHSNTWDTGTHKPPVPIFSTRLPLEWYSLIIFFKNVFSFAQADAIVGESCSFDSVVWGKLEKEDINWQDSNKNAHTHRHTIWD